MKFGMILFLIIVLTNSKLITATIYREIHREDRIVAIKIGTAKIKIGYHRVIHTINLEKIENNLNYIQN